MSIKKIGVVGQGERKSSAQQDFVANGRSLKA
jgi:hypothetical protein